MTKIIGLMPSNNGARTATSGLMEELSREISFKQGSIPTIISIEPDQLNTVAAHLGGKEPSFVITTSLEHLNTVEKIGKSRQESQTNTKIIWSSHQMPDRNKIGFSILDHYADFIVLPEYERDYIGSHDMKARCVFTDGVPHTTTRDSVLEDFKKYSNGTFLDLRKLKHLDARSGFDIVIMGGDFEARDGTIIPYSSQMAFEDGLNMGKTLKDRLKLRPSHHFIVTNGPRTGKHTDNHAHRDSTALDSVSEAYLAGMRETMDYRVLERHISFFDFRFKPEGFVDSVLKPALNLIDNNSRIYCEGMSITMAHEILAVKTEKSALILTEIEGMQASHYAHTRHMRKNGWAWSMGKAGQTQSPSGLKMDYQAPTIQAAKAISAKLFNTLAPSTSPALRK